MADLLGVACNTYSKWERGYQPPPPFACRAVELLLYVTLANKGHFKGESHAMALLARFTRDAGKGDKRKAARKKKEKVIAASGLDKENQDEDSY